MGVTIFKLRAAGAQENAAASGAHSPLNPGDYEEHRAPAAASQAVPGLSSFRCPALAFIRYQARRRP